MRCTDWGEGFVAGAVAVISVVNRIVGPQTREVEARVKPGATRLRSERDGMTRG